MVFGYERWRVREIAGVLVLTAGLTAGCAPGKGESTTEGPEGTTTSEGPGSMSHSATSAPPPTGEPPGEVPPVTSEPVTSSATSVGPVTTGVEPSTTSAGPTATSSAGTTGGPGTEGYGPCQDGDPQCPGETECIVIVDIPGDFCAPRCDANTPCPAIDDGATAMCALVQGPGMEPTHCALVCDLMAPDPGCPAGTSCKPVPQQTVGLCTAS